MDERIFVPFHSCLVNCVEIVHIPLQPSNKKYCFLIASAVCMINDSLDQQLFCFAENETSQECMLLIGFQENFGSCYENNSV